MIAEYERAQIAERSRRGKRHRAQQGSINVLSGAPYGYRYVKKTILRRPTTKSWSRRPRWCVLSSMPIPARPQHWCHCRLTQPTRGRDADATEPMERPTLWRMLHNPAYAGHAFYGKTELRPRRRITRRQRQRGLCSRDSSFGNGLVRSGSRSLSPLWSAKQPSLWRKNSSRKIRGFLPDAPSNHPCCKGCWSVSVVAMDSIELRRELPSAQSTTIAA